MSGSPEAPAPVGILVRGVSRIPRGGTAARGFFTPRVPPQWLLDAFHESLDQVLDELSEVARAGIARLPNRNLESGERQDGGDPHPESIAVRHRLERLRTDKADERD